MRDPPPSTHTRSHRLPSECKWVERIPLPSLEGSRSTAPAPSPNKMQVLRSVQSMIADITSVPINNTLRQLPERTYRSATASPYRNPEQAAAKSNAKARMAFRFLWIRQAVDGKGMSGVHVATTIRSRLVGSHPARASAACAASVPRSELAMPSATILRS